jgi:hypothetical protein
VDDGYIFGTNDKEILNKEAFNVNKLATYDRDATKENNDSNFYIQLGKNSETSLCNILYE